MSFLAGVDHAHQSVDFLAMLVEGFLRSLFELTYLAEAVLLLLDILLPDLQYFRGGLGLRLRL